MTCELSKFRESIYKIAGVDGSTSAIKMKNDLLFLPTGGKYLNPKLKTVENSYMWGEYIKNKINELYGNTKGYYGNLIDLTITNPMDKKQGTYVHINFTPQLQKAIAYKNGELSKIAYEQYLEYEAYNEYMAEKAFESEAEHQIIEDKIRSGEIKQICDI